MRIQGYYKIQCPTKPYLAKYLHALYGDPLIFRKDCYFGTSLMGYLAPQFYERMKNESIIHKAFDGFTKPLDVYLPTRWMKRGVSFGKDLPRENIIYLNKHFEQRFEEDLVKHCHTLTAVGLDIKDAIEDFCRIMHIEIDEDGISYEGVKRKELRRRNVMKGIYKDPPQKRDIKKAYEKSDSMDAPHVEPPPFIQLALTL